MATKRKKRDTLRGLIREIRRSKERYVEESEDFEDRLRKLAEKDDEEEEEEEEED